MRPIAVTTTRYPAITSQSRRASVMRGGAEHHSPSGCLHLPMAIGRQASEEARIYLWATIVNEIPSASFTLTTPPTEIGLMPKSLCLIVACPEAVSVSASGLMVTATVIVFVT